MQTSVAVLAHSVNEDDDQIVTFLCTMHRFVLAEMNTHRLLVKSSASSRAIPVTKTLTRYNEDPAWPLEWASEQRGMQGGAELTGRDLDDAQRLLRNIHAATGEEVEMYLAAHPDPSTRLHKSVINRYLEPLQWHTVVITATAVQNFFALRNHPDAQPEIREVARLMQETYNASSPTMLRPGEWHLPFIDQDDYHAVFLAGLDPQSLRDISVARCARSSYLMPSAPEDAPRKPTLDEDFTLYQRLTTAVPMHAAPLEHVATPNPANKHEVRVPIIGSPDLVLTLPMYGPLLGWHPHRFDVEARLKYQSFA